MSAYWLVLRHVAHEHLGTLAPVLAAQGIQYRYLDVYRGDPVPADLAAIGGLIVMGGPMGVYEEDNYPFLRPEIELIGKAARAALPVIGICLGSQLIAAALGAHVYSSGKKEIGWYEVRSVAPHDVFASALPVSFMGFHWHGDTFDLPSGSVRLFESDLFPNQGFRWGGNVLALQFHFEVDRQMVSVWLKDGGCQAEIAGVPELSAEAILRDTALYGEQLEKLSATYFTSILNQMIIARQP